MGKKEGEEGVRSVSFDLDLCWNGGYSMLCRDDDCPYWVYFHWTAVEGVVDATGLGKAVPKSEPRRPPCYQSDDWKRD